MSGESANMSGPEKKLPKDEQEPDSLFGEQDKIGRQVEVNWQAFDKNGREGLIMGIGQARAKAKAKQAEGKEKAIWEEAAHNLKVKAYERIAQSPEFERGYYSVGRLLTFVAECTRETSAPTNDIDILGDVALRRIDQLQQAEKASVA